MDDLLSIDRVSKSFSDVIAVDNISINIEQSEFLTLLGPSGSGKTTLLNMIAGFETPCSGRILLKHRDITTVPPNKRDIGMVFQNYALFPHITVFENIAFPLKMRKIPANQIIERTKEALDLVKLAGFEKRYPSQLSGGQQQRVAIARALVFEPAILLMDEPLGALDKKLRDHMRLEIRYLKEKLGITVIYVTHDQEEALTMSDRIAIINKGRIVQIDTPIDLYESPAQLFVADFIGKSNSIKGSSIETKDHEVVVKTEEGLQVFARPGRGLETGKRVFVTIRPEKIRLFFDDKQIPSDIVNIFYGTIKYAVYMGEAVMYGVRLTKDLDIEVRIQTLGRPHYKTGDKVIAGWSKYNCLALN